jgi:CDP-paratose 2-epimerase
LDSRRAATLWNWTPARKLPSILEEIAQHAETHPDWLKLFDG